MENAWVRVVGRRIVTVGRGRPGRPAIALDDCIVVPGLINAHTHLEFSALARPLDPAGGLADWIERVVALRRGERGPVASAQAHHDADLAVAAAVARGLEESAADGVTTIGEIATCLAPPVLDRLTTGGPRVRVFREALGLAAGRAAGLGAATRRDLDALAQRCLPAGLSPHAPYSVAAPLGRRLLALARGLRLPLAMHVAESADETPLVETHDGPLRDLLARLGAWPDRPPRLLSAADWITTLARATRGIVVHGTFLDRDATALARLIRHRDRLAVVVCPRTTLALSGRLPPIARFREAGVRVGIGTDSRASNPDLALRAECRTLIDAGVVSPAEALMMATTHGAWALGFERCGRIAAGLAADLVILRPASLQAEPCAAALEADTRVVATLRAGRLIAGTLSA